MILSSLPPVTLRDLAAANPASLHRSPGLHVTQIIYEGIMPAVDPRRWGPDAKATNFPEGASENWQEMGFVWEEVLSGVFAARASSRPTEIDTVTRFRPDELISPEGIIGSPDALVYGLTDYPDVPPVVLEEYKATWKGSKSFDLYDKRYLGWLMQIRAYCVLAATTEARLYIFHINGGYEGYIPEIRAWRLQFTPAELRDQWLQLINTAKKRGWL